MKREKFERELLKQLRNPQKENKALVSAALEMHMKMVGREFVSALTPLCETSAPFVVAALEYYAKEIRNKYKCDNRFIESLKEFVSGKDFLPKAPELKKKGANT